MSILCPSQNEIYLKKTVWFRASQLTPVLKSLLDNAGDIREVSSIPGLVRFSGEGNGTPLQYSCLGNPMDREAWWATVHGVTKSWIQLNTQTVHRRSGPQKIRWLDGITDSVDFSLSKLRERVKNREVWCTAVLGIAKTRAWLVNWTEIAMQFR